MLGSVLVLDMSAIHRPYIYYFFLMFSCGVSSILQSYLQSATINFCTRLDIGGNVLSYMLLGQALNGALGSAVNLVSSWLAAQYDAHEQSSAHYLQNSRAATVVYVWTLLLQCLALALFRATLREPAVKSRIEAYMNQHQGASAEGDTSWSRIVAVQKRIVPWSASIFGLFLVTLTIYPGLTSRVRTLTHLPWLQNPSVFVAWHLVAMNMGDLLGRRLPLLLPWLNVRDSRIAVGTTLIRWLFLPAILACHLQPDQTRSLSDTTFFALIFLLGLTSGLLSTSFLVSGSQSVQGSSRICLEDATLLSEQQESQTLNVWADEDAATASMLLVFWLVCGLAAGAFMSLVMNVIIG